MTSTMLVFYRFRSMNDQEKEKANKQWHELKNSLPAGIELLGEYDHAWGTEYNGFYYLKLKLAICFWTGGLVLRTRLDGMLIRHIR
jgi:hypothetical protein